MQYKKFIPLPALALSLIPFVSQVNAAGFQLNEHSAAGLGRAFAGEAAMADDASVVARNPAAMSLLKRPELTVVGTYVVPDVKIEGTGATAAGAVPLKEDRAASRELIPAVYYVQPVNDQLAFGFGMFSWFGLSTDYGDKSGISGIADESSITTVNLTPSLSYRINESFSVGLGLNAVFVDAMLSSSVNQGKLFKMEGDDWAFGWNVGALWEISQNTRIGLSYRSEVETRIEGKVKSDIINGTIDIPGHGRTNWNKNGYVKLDLPQIAELSLWQRLTDETTLQLSAMWFGWSSLKEIAPKLKDGTYFPAEELHWDDSWRYAVGITHDLNPAWVLRFGVAYDQTPTNNKYRTYRIPDSDRTWYTFGATWKISPNQSLDFGYAYLNGEKVDIKQSGLSSSLAPMETSAEVTKGNAQIFSMQYNHRF